MEWEAGERMVRLADRPEVRRAVALHPESASRGGARRRRWLAAAMREAYDRGWVPEEAVANLRHVRVEGDSVVLTLMSGTRLVDRQDRIEIEGRVDDVSVSEIVEAVRRHGWPAVTVEGDMEFRVAAAKALLALEPPVRVKGSVLSEFEEAEIEDGRDTSAPPPARSRPRSGGEQGSPQAAWSSRTLT